MDNTTAQEIYESFESSFQDKRVIPDGLELEWLKKAVGRYSLEIDELNFDAENGVFDSVLSRSVIDTLAEFIRVYYQEREVARVNKRVSIVTPNLSIDGTNGSKTSAKNELEYHESKAAVMAEHHKTTAYA